MTIQYKQGNAVAPNKSSMGMQTQDFLFYRKALVDLQDERFFMPLADVRSMPKHYGKTIKQYHYIPLLDDRNVNDQGLDAAGSISVNGNLYGSSKDIGTIVSKFPALSETGGRKNRVGYTRKSIEGSIQMLGFFDEFTRESMDFDSDDKLEEHLSRESLRGAIKMSEAALQIDLLNGAGLVKYSGPATIDDEISGEPTLISEVTYNDLVRLNIDLDNSKAPKSTEIITGSRMIDTRVVGNARYLYCGSELLPTLMRMKDFHEKAAFIGVEHYADAGSVINGEAGTVAGFRVVIVPEMLHWAASGAEVVTANGNGYRSSTNSDSEDRYDIFPMLFVGSGSFTTIGFQTTDAGGVKFEIIIKKPGKEMATTADPFGELGFHSIRWYYGTMILRSEWLAVQKTVAPL